MEESGGGQRHPRRLKACRTGEDHWPYNLEINDSIIYAIERHATGEMARRLELTLKLFERESLFAPRVLAIGLHPHLIAVPHRFHELERMIDLLRASPAKK